MSKLQAANDYPDVTTGQEPTYYPGELAQPEDSTPQTAQERVSDEIAQNFAHRSWELSKYTTEELTNELTRRRPF